MTDTSAPARFTPAALWRAVRLAPGDSPNASTGRMRGLWPRAAGEAIGTFALVLIGTGAAMVDAYTRGALGPAGVAMAFGGVVAAMVYALGHVSGAHINPAVTLALSYSGCFPRREVPYYVAAQCTGAVAASFALRKVLGTVGGLGATLPVIGVARSFAVEWLFSFVLMFVIYSVTTDERVAPGFAAIPVGLAVGFGVLVGGPLTGGSMNPARSLGPLLAGGAWAGHWIYWAAPVTAMLVAVRVYEFLRPAGTFVDGPALPGVEPPATAAEDGSLAAGLTPTRNGPGDGAELPRAS